MGKVLIVDDNKYIKIVLSLLVEETGFEPITAHDCETAFKNIESEKPNLVILDHKLPDGEGISFLKKIKTIYPDLPVIILSAYTDLIYAENAIKTGAYAFISKPFDNNEMVGIIKHAARI